MAREAFHSWTAEHDNEPQQSGAFDLLREWLNQGGAQEGPQTRPTPQTRPPLLAAKTGDDSRAVSTPAGRRYSGAEVVVEERTRPGTTAHLKSEPATGATGQGQVVVTWVCPPRGKLKYRATVFSEPAAQTTVPAAPVEVIILMDQTALEKVQSAVRSKRRVIVRLSPDDAKKAIESGIAEKLGAAQANAVAVAVVDWTLVIMLAIGAGAGLIFMGLLTWIAFEAMNHGYRLDARITNENGLPGFDMELIPPA